MDDNEQQNAKDGGQDGTQKQAAEAEGSRMDQAKAFFRALHAGGESAPAEFGSGAAPEPAAGPCPNCQRMEQQLAEAEQRAQEAEGLYRRMAADFENYRRRVDKEREEFQAAGVQRTVEALLPALDDIDRAMANLNADTPADKLMESLKLVFNRFTRCFEQMGVKAMSVVGEHFDPKYHEPVQEVPTTEFPDGSVIHELRRGYTLNDRVVRPALVNVASNAGEAQPAPEAPEAVGEAHEPGAEERAADEGGNPKEPKVYDLSEFEGSDGVELEVEERLRGQRAESSGRSD